MPFLHFQKARSPRRPPEPGKGWGAWGRWLAAIPLALLLAGCASSQTPTRSSSSSPSSSNSPGIQKGLASYYGGKYHGRRTANGETFDKNGLTAAHPNISFGTLLRVTNLENGRSVVVRVNDRYNPIKGRIIDLSEGAFYRLAPLSQGIIPVRIELAR
ncbi:MAG: septal ring lytic transglycosylase RlpA family protein [Verrucomicrobiae bacterium]|nr:septal ring lytic transglycosylase RlpA family protein [Verrucomicrobiae bacterium]